MRKCCSNEAISDEQCINTEQYYHGFKLSEYDSLSDNSQIFQGKAAEDVDGKLPTKADRAKDPDIDEG